MQNTGEFRAEILMSVRKVAAHTIHTTHCQHTRFEAEI